MAFKWLQKKNLNSSYIRLYQKTAFGIDFGLWEVLEIDDDDDDDYDDHNDYYDVFSVFQRSSNTFGTRGEK